MRKLKTMMLALCCGVSFSLQAQESPADMLDQVAHQVLTVLKSHQSELKAKPQIVRQAVETYLLPHVDIAGMSRSVLGREAWTKASAAEKAAFSQAFTQLVIRTYSTPISKYNGETIKFYPVRGGVQGRFVQVESEIVRTSGPSIPLHYSMVSKGGQWKVYDLTVEGISLLQSYHSQFEQALQRSTLSELTRQIQQQKAA